MHDGPLTSYFGIGLVNQEDGLLGPNGNGSSSKLAVNRVIVARTSRTQAPVSYVGFAGLYGPA